MKSTLMLLAWCGLCTPVLVGCHSFRSRSIPIHSLTAEHFVIFRGEYLRDGQMPIPPTGLSLGEALDTHLFELDSMSTKPLLVMLVRSRQTIYLPLPFGRHCLAGQFPLLDGDQIQVVVPSLTPFGQTGETVPSGEPISIRGLVSDPGTLRTSDELQTLGDLISQLGLDRVQLDPRENMAEILEIKRVADRRLHRLILPTPKYASLQTQSDDLTRVLQADLGVQHGPLRPGDVVDVTRLIWLPELLHRQLSPPSQSVEITQLPRRHGISILR